jgi:peptide/nickel transport system substrate-binding protein
MSQLPPQVPQTPADSVPGLSRRRFLALSSSAVALTSASGLLAACGGDDDDSGGGGGGGAAATTILGQAYPSIPGQIDPTQYSGSDIILINGNVYATPVKFVTKDLGNGFPEVDIQNPEVEPWLAESLESSSDLKNWKLTLRDDVVSSRGNPLTTEDVRFTVERNLAIPGNGQIIVQFAGVTSMKNVKVVDERTVEFPLDEGNRLFPQLMQNQFGFGVVDATEAKKHATDKDPHATKWLARNDAGFGPYRVAAFTPQRMDFELNPGYKLDKPQYKTINWLGVPEPGARLNLIQTGDVQVINELQPVQLEALKSNDKVKLFATNVSAPSDQVLFNVSVPELRDPRVRSALAWAIPRQGILDSVYRGTATEWKTPLGGEEYRGADASLNPFTGEDAEKAKELIKAAGAEGAKIQLNYDTSSFWQKDVAVQLQSAWNAIGVDIEVVGLAPAVWGEKLGAKEMPVFMIPFGWFVPDFFYVMNLLYNSKSGVNSTTFNNKEADRLLNAGMNEPDANKRDQLAADFQKVFYEDLPAAAVAVRDAVTAIRTPITGFTGWTNGMVYWADLSSESS